MPPKLSITLNGEPTTLPSDKLEDLLDSLNLQNKRYAVTKPTRFVNIFTIFNEFLNITKININQLVYNPFTQKISHKYKECNLGDIHNNLLINLIIFPEFL